MHCITIMEYKENLADWMAELDPQLKNFSICYLAIPGSHDSLSFSVTHQSSISPDAPRIAKILYRICSPIMKRVTYNWCLTQSVDIDEQFRRGIRYFDLRIAINGSNLYSCHALYGMNIIEALNIFNKLLLNHSKEVIILDFQHFYGLTNDHHQYLIAQIHSIFDDKLCAYEEDVTELTLSRMQEQNKQVIIVYRNEYVYQVPTFWPSPCWLTLWPNTTNITKLSEYLSLSLSIRPKHAGFVSQCVFTPSPMYITWHLFSTLKNSCAIFCDKKIMSIWIRNQKCLTPTGVNVIIADFIDLSDLEFGRTVIDLNKKSLLST